ncbi:unnamed protein product, partial [Scytosiphon promiscuus]
QELPGLSEALIVDGAGLSDTPPATYNFRLYSGKMLELYGRNLYKLDGKLCKGAFTGDDFCNEVHKDSYESFEDAIQEHATFSLHTEL